MMLKVLLLIVTVISNFIDVTRINFCWESSLIVVVFFYENMHIYEVQPIRISFREVIIRLMAFPGKTEVIWFQISTN